MKKTGITSNIQENLQCQLPGIDEKSCSFCPEAGLEPEPARQAAVRLLDDGGGSVEFSRLSGFTLISVIALEKKELQSMFISSKRGQQCVCFPCFAEFQEGDLCTRGALQCATSCR